MLYLVTLMQQQRRPEPTNQKMPPLSRSSMERTTLCSLTHSEALTVAHPSSGRSRLGPPMPLFDPTLIQREYNRWLLNSINAFCTAHSSILQLIANTSRCPSSPSLTREHRRRIYFRAQFVLFSPTFQPVPASLEDHCLTVSPDTIQHPALTPRFT